MVINDFMYIFNSLQHKTIHNIYYATIKFTPFLATLFAVFFKCFHKFFCSINLIKILFPKIDVPQ